MIWLTWRQFRGHALAALAALVALAIYLGFLGSAIRGSYDANLVDCEAVTCSVAAATAQLEEQYGVLLQLTGVALVATPAVIGMFWGAPLVARELESGTNALVWTQSVSRRYWLAVKLTVLGALGVAVTGVFSLLLSWAAAPYDELLGNRFDAIVFAARGISPLGYAVFAFALGTTAGLIVRRTVPAMAITLAGFAVVQVVVPFAVRSHFQPAVTESVPFSASSFEKHDARLNLAGETARVEGYRIADAWVLSSATDLLDTDGDPIATKQVRECVTGDLDEDVACMAGRDPHFDLTYQPADRYWDFQRLEVAAFVALTAMLVSGCFWRISSGPGRP